MPNITFYDTLSRSDKKFEPIDANHVKMYACGPTVYDRPHIGNARSAVVYDVLARFLKAVYPKVTYARNITDVDDKINAAAKERGITIQALTQEITQFYHDDMDALGVMRPDVEPRATEHIPEMIAMIEKLIANGHAYAAEGHALFAVGTDPHYGCLSRRNRDEMIAGARVEVAPYKKDPADFVLWKPSLPGDDASSVFDSPWGKGRPGWHIECSAMSSKYLGETFDIHGGGADLMFPHHENEIAQSVCANKGSEFARYWVHNGFLTVNGEKMSKSLGNFITVRDLLGKGVKGEVIRFALMSTHYRKPLDWSDKLLDDAQKSMDGFYRKLETAKLGAKVPETFLEALADDVNVPKAVALLHTAQPDELLAMGKMLGLFNQTVDAWFKGGASEGDAAIDEEVEKYKAARAVKDFAAADAIRDALKAQGIIVEARKDGTAGWRRA